MTENEINAVIIKEYEPLFLPSRYKIYYGGRGGAKSWAFAEALVLLAYQKPLLILCTRQFQNSIADSVHRTIRTQIERRGLDPWFDVTKTSIKSAVGAEFIFKGLERSIQEIKSTEGIDICWVEEAQSTTEDSWEILIPTIRKEDSEIWISFNPNEETDPTYKRFVTKTPPNSVLRKVNWRDNPYFPKVLDDERRYMLKIDPDAYQHVWEGFCRQITDAVILRGHYEVRTFDYPPEGIRFYYGADWGFSQDPTVLLRCWIKDNTLYIDHEVYGVGMELDDTPARFEEVPGSKLWPIKADNARPETISHVKRRGFKISGAKKWAGSIEDGITVLRGFKKIVVHERCKHTAEECRLYSYKVDKKTNEILPIIVDKHNNCIDAIRYALVDVIRASNLFDGCDFS